MNTPTELTDAAADAAWKRYPYAIPGADQAWFTFPAAEGDQGTGANTYFIECPLRGIRTGRNLALMAIFTAMRVPLARLTLRADFYVFALFDLDAGTYGTITDFDLPQPLRVRRTHKLKVARGVLDVSYETSEGRARWTTRRDAAGAPVPFSYALDLRGRDGSGRAMAATLDVEVAKPPAPVGGDELGGVKTCCMQLGTFSYFQTGLALRGRVRWGDFEDEVRGDAGLIDRQYAREHFGKYTDLGNTRHRHEWRVLHLDNGWDMSVWQQFDAERGDRLVPFSGVTAQGPDGAVRATTDFHVERLSFVRDPGHVKPMKALPSGTAFLTDRFHLTVRDWGLSVTAEPCVAAPAHGMPIEYWNGPIRVIGQMGGRPVSGFGFHERSKLWFRPHELVFVLRETLRHLPATGHHGPSPQAIANRVWQCDVLLARGDVAGARRYLEEQVAPALDALASGHRDAAIEVYDALLTAL
ncbi:MAG: secreted hydrolase [Deltaproteobacteria bacterium]|nr:secreted hydrolase [Deltaproteobacteria bacterium]